MESDPSMRSDVQRLLALATRAPGLKHADEWYAEIHNARTETLIGLVAALGNVGVSGSWLESHRESVRAELERRHAQAIVEQTERLERASNRLQYVGLVIAAVGAVLTILQFWEPAS